MSKGLNGVPVALYECPMGWKSVQKERGMLRGEAVCLQGVRDELSIG